MGMLPLIFYSNTPAEKLPWGGHTPAAVATDSCRLLLVWRPRPVGATALMMVLLLRRVCSTAALLVLTLMNVLQGA